MDTEQYCPECGSEDLEQDHGAHTLICGECNHEWDDETAYSGPSDYSERMTERRMMGISG